MSLFNSHCVTALVQTDNDQALPVQAFDSLMNVVSQDLAEGGLPRPQYLADYQELRGGGVEGLVSNMDELRRSSHTRHVRENEDIMRLAPKAAKIPFLEGVGDSNSVTVKDFWTFEALKTVQLNFSDI